MPAREQRRVIPVIPIATPAIPIVLATLTIVAIALAVTVRNIRIICAAMARIAQAAAVGDRLIELYPIEQGVSACL